MQTAQRDEFDLLAGQINKIFDHVWHQHFSVFSPTEGWSPPVNLYRLANRLEVCVDLAGVERKSIDVRVEPGRLTIRGLRAAPEPPRDADEVMRILTMEIDHGSFCRVLKLPERVDLARIESEYKNGLLWVRLPLREAG
ncbi:MAG: Hsp20/alpha crystallin family protein [Phycisphaeraceae bacterium]